MSMFFSEIDMIDDTLLNKLIKEGTIEIIFCGTKTQEQIEEFYVYPKDKQGKSKTKILIRNHIDGARNGKEMKHGASIKVYDPNRDVYIPVLLKLDKNGKVQMPDDIAKDKDNKDFINKKSKILKRLLTNEGEEYQKYWDADSKTLEGQKLMQDIEIFQKNKYSK